MNAPDFRGVMLDFRVQQALADAVDKAYEDELAATASTASKSAHQAYRRAAMQILECKDQVFEDDVIVLLYAVRQHTKLCSLAMHDEAFISAVERVDEAISILWEASEERARQSEKVEA